MLGENERERMSQSKKSLPSGVERTQKSQWIIIELLSLDARAAIVKCCVCQCGWNTMSALCFRFVHMFKSLKETKKKINERKMKRILHSSHWNRRLYCRKTLCVRHIFIYITEREREKNELNKKNKLSVAYNKRQAVFRLAVELIFSSHFSVFLFIFSLVPCSSLPSISLFPFHVISLDICIFIHECFEHRLTRSFVRLHPCLGKCFILLFLPLFIII